MKIDIVLEPNVPAKKFGELAKLAESYGIGTVWTANHPTARDPFMTFTGVAQATDTIRMGPIAISPFEMHPLKMANALFTLSEMAEGRTNIVIGGGGGTTIAMGLKPDRHSMMPRMVRAVRECVEFIKQAKPDALLNYQGEVYNISNYKAAWATSEPPCLYVAASREKMLRMGAQVADGIMLSDVTLHRMEETTKVVTDTLAESGRSLKEFKFNNLYAWHVKSDLEEAKKEARRKLWVRGMLFPWYIEPFLSAEDAKIVADNMQGVINAYITNTPEIKGIEDRIIDEILKNLTFTGTLDDVDHFIGEMKKFEAAGLNEFALRLYDDPEESIKLIGARVVPALT